MDTIDGRPLGECNAVIADAIRAGRTTVCLEGSKRSVVQRLYAHSMRATHDALITAASLAGISAEIPTITIRPRVADVLRRVKERLSFDEWNVGIIDGHPYDDILSGRWPKVTWFPAPQRGCFAADPIAADDEVFYEFYNGKRKRGEIRRMRDGTQVGQLSDDVHRSYPFVLDVDGCRYIVPEQGSSTSTQAFALDGTDVRVLLDIAIVDPTILHHEEKWYLFGGLPGATEMLTLHVWIADEPLGPYRPLSHTPISTTVIGSRMAGPFFRHKGVLFRPGQDYSRRYGGGIVIHRVHTCQPDAYDESVEAVLTADSSWPWNEGIHTISSGKNFIAIDAVRSVLRT